MRELQGRIIQEMGVAPRIDPAREVEDRVLFLADYVRAARARTLVLGISGGVDSTLAGRLAQMAAAHLRADGYDAEFVALRLPHSVQGDEDDTRAALAFIGPDRTHEIDIAPGVDGFDDAYTAGVGARLPDFHRGNVKARLRMIAHYAVAGDSGGLVVGTDQASESTVGYFTKFGDGGADILPLFTLNKRQVHEILQHLGASERLWAKQPTADLLDDQPGLSDEDQLGIRYDDLDDYLEGGEVPDDVAARIEDLYLRSRHKRRGPVTVRDTWWR